MGFWAVSEFAVLRGNSYTNLRGMYKPEVNSRHGNQRKKSDYTKWLMFSFLFPFFTYEHMIQWFLVSNNEVFIDRRINRIHVKLSKYTLGLLAILFAFQFIYPKD